MNIYMQKKSNLAILLLAQMAVLPLSSCVTRDKPTVCHNFTVEIGRCVLWAHGPEWWGLAKKPNASGQVAAKEKL